MNIVVKSIKDHVPREAKLLDIGCGMKKHEYYTKDVTTIDAWDKLDPDILMDVSKEPLPFEEDSFDVITMIDFIEHIEKHEGEELLEQCKKIASRIIVFTPLFFNDNSHNVENPNCWAYGNPYDYHKSLWTLDDFSDWTTIDIFTFKDGKVWLGYWER